MSLPSLSLSAGRCPSPLSPCLPVVALPLSPRLLAVAPPPPFSLPARQSLSLSSLYSPASCRPSLALLKSEEVEVVEAFVSEPDGASAGAHDRYRKLKLCDGWAYIQIWLK